MWIEGPARAMGRLRELPAVIRRLRPRPDRERLDARRSLNGVFRVADSPQPSVAEIAAYIAETCAELRRIAKAPRLRTISYLLDSIRIEAEKVAQEETRSADPPLRRSSGDERRYRPRSVLTRTERVGGIAP